MVAFYETPYLPTPYHRSAHAGPAFREPLWAALPPRVHPWAEGQIGIVESLVIRMVAEPPAEELARDPLLVWTDGYAGFPVARQAFKGGFPSVPALRPVDDMRAEELRKLYTYNTFHDDQMSQWIAGVLAQTNNPALRDTVARYGADPRRKLRRSDRLVGPLLLARKHEIAAPHLTRTLAAAFLYQNPDDAGAMAVQARIAALGLPGAVRALCELTEDEADIVAAVERACAQLEGEAVWVKRAREAGALAFQYEQTYHGCGQCALAAILDTLGEFDTCAADAVFEAATGLAGGLGLAGDAACGALVGATLAFGMLYPRHRQAFDGDRENRYRVYAMVQRLRERYLAAYGSIICHDIHRAVLGRPFDLRDSAERKAFEAAGAHDKCTGVVQRAVEWAVEIIGEQRPGLISRI